MESKVGIFDRGSCDHGNLKGPPPPPNLYPLPSCEKKTLILRRKGLVEGLLTTIIKYWLVVSNIFFSPLPGEMTQFD